MVSPFFFFGILSKKDNWIISGPNFSWPPPEPSAPGARAPGLCPQLSLRCRMRGGHHCRCTGSGAGVFKERKRRKTFSWASSFGPDARAMWSSGSSLAVVGGVCHLGSGGTPFNSENEKPRKYGDMAGGKVFENGKTRSHFTRTPEDPSERQVRRP